MLKEHLNASRRAEREVRDLGPARRIHLERVAQTDLTLQRRLVLLRYGSRVC